MACYRIVDLFCGAGGLSLGFKSNRFELAYAVDNDQVAVDHYNENVANVAVCKDIMALDPKELPEADGIIGGPPCQAFSLTGKRLATDPRSSLSIRFAQIVTKRHPRFFVMENVDGLLSLEISHLLLNIFKNAGYKVEINKNHVLTLDAVDYGVPQFRRRPFFIGFLRGEGSLRLMQPPLPPSERRTVRQTLVKYEYPWYYRMPRHYGRRAVYSVDEPSPTIRTANRPIPSTYRRHPRDAPYSEGQVRALTAEERALIQSFPCDFSWFGTKTVKEKLVGNAVPPKLASVIAEAIKTIS